MLVFGTVVNVFSFFSWPLYFCMIKLETVVKSSV